MYLVDFVKVILVFVSLLPLHKFLMSITSQIFVSSFGCVCSEPDDMKNVLGFPHWASQSKDVMTEVDKRH